MFTIKTTRSVDDSQIENILTSALETSVCNYWLTLTGYRKPRGPVPEYRQGYPLGRYGYLEFQVEDGTKRYRLGRRAIQKGLQVMAEKDPCAFDDLVTEHDDANTADVFMQCCLLGEVIYG